MMNRICVIGSIIIIAVMIALPTYKNVKKIKINDLVQFMR